MKKLFMLIIVAVAVIGFALSFNKTTQETYLDFDDLHTPEYVHV